MNQSIVLLTVLIVWNLITFLLIRIDKYKAIKSKYRISEKALFLSAFFLGGLGILSGMYVFRHKTKHMNFKVLVPVAVLVNAFLVYYLFQFVSG